MSGRVEGAASKPHIEPWRVSGPAEVMTIFGPTVVSGPFADDWTRLSWQFTDHRDGETAVYRVAGLEAYVADQDGDASYWELRDMRLPRRERVIAEGSDCGFDPHHFFRCLYEAEAALRAEVDLRKRRFGARRLPPMDTLEGE